MNMLIFDFERKCTFNNNIYEYTWWYLWMVVL